MPSGPDQAIAQVEPLTLTRAVRGPFDYRLGAHEPDVEVGTVLRIPFGRRSTLGVVVGLSDHSEIAPNRLAEPEAVLDSGIPPTWSSWPRGWRPSTAPPRRERSR